VPHHVLVFPIYALLVARVGVGAKPVHFASPNIETKLKLVADTGITESLGIGERLLTMRA
jgi:hypothetical protein